MEKSTKSRIIVLIVATISILLTIIYAICAHDILSSFGTESLKGSVIVSICVRCIVSIVATVLFILYVLSKSPKKQRLISSSLVLITAYRIVCAFLDVSAYGSMGGYIQFFLNLLILAPIIIVTVDSFRSFKLTTKIAVIPKICFFALCIVSIISVARYFTGVSLINIISELATEAYWISVFVVMMQLVPEKHKKAPIANLESQLILLKKQYESGQLSEDDYKQRKADILNKL